VLANAQLFGTKLSALLAPLYQHDTFVHVDDGNVWLRVAFQGNKDIFYACLFPSHRHILMGKLKQELFKFVRQSLALLFECEDLVVTKVQGKYASGLVEMVKYGNLQGHWKQYTQPQETPLVHPSKRSKTQDILSYVEEDEKIVMDDYEAYKTREHTAEYVFGQHVQARLDTLQQDVRIEVEDVRLDVGVKIHGSNVLEGVKELVKLDMARLPLATWLTASGVAHD
jgi:hypothetical protein